MCKRIVGYRDGDDAVVVYKGYGNKLEKLLGRLPNAEMVEESTLEPSKTEAQGAQDVVLTNALPEEFVGLTPSEVLAEKADSRFGVLWQYREEKRKELQALDEALDKFLKLRWKDVDPYKYAENLNDKQVKRLFSCYQYPLSKTQRQAIADQSGYASLEDFLEYAELPVKRSAAAAVVEFLKKW